ncbi:M23 family peptidase [Roseburia sp. AF25-13LB]|nr:M23 family peptidase [Roseburia sp. AF34-16]RHQ39771.1 M23 family peptidase [Roseburia sp. AF25-25LB]RHQ44866.1 M23 family peptidase [Roseburia sp. AF25-18LB]RHQ52035.1 M23 family peptidase [Roseburia sp. AF25-15LB]RHQ52693.1 M23 family peptidase [Roseburia sp. AF25-13LB]
MTFTRYLLAYYASDLTEKNELKDVYKRLLHFHKEEIEKQEAYLDSIWSDIVYFPVPDTIWDEEKKVTFGDTWMQSRTYGGDRGHEGCDIMADINERGNYPVISVCDGTIEQMGWLELGGYRIGIRSPHGAYFYYAHLSDYAEGLSIGDEVHAGELIAFMGDTGYSKTEGTVGNFDVHLHFGIYLNDENKREFSVNSYSILQYLYQEKKILHYQY